MTTQPFLCPFCNNNSTISEDDFDYFNNILYHSNIDGLGILATTFIVCPNPNCKKVSLKTELFKKVLRSGNYVKGDKVKEWQLLPQSNAKVFPEYIPKSIKNDYEEACSILTLSPKASATLSRRCIQEMIRDYWKIKEPDNHKGYWNLVDEIKAIKDMVEIDVWEAIDAVRNIGNIGAHMEKDINLIINVEPHEAERLIELIEMLVDEWYINRSKRQSKLEEIKKIAQNKDSIKKQS